jgi:hypothetical protein
VNSFEIVLLILFMKPLGDGDSAPSSVGGSGVPSPVSVSAADVAMEDLKEEKRPVFKDPDFQVLQKLVYFVQSTVL